MKVRKGICVKCGSDNLEYLGIDNGKGNGLFLMYRCSSCMQQGEEYYQFRGHNLIINTQENGETYRYYSKKDDEDYIESESDE